VVRFVGGDNQGAEADFVRAAALAPGSAHALFYRSWFLAHFGRYDECVATARELEAVSPETPTDNLGWCLWLKQEYADAAAALDRHRVVKHDDALYLAKLASAFARSGRVIDAQALRKQIREMAPAGPGRHSGVDYHLVWVHLAEGDRAGAAQLAELWRRKEPQSGNLLTFVAQMYGALDDVDSVVDSAARSVDVCLDREPCAGGAPLLEQFYQEPSFFSPRLRSDPRMLALVRRLKSAASSGPER
jgi:tetratricopeptide (TPR) repeat protein